jgi:IclR family acetate operon transcriptional repressor
MAVWRSLITLGTFEHSAKLVQSMANPTVINSLSRGVTILRLLAAQPAGMGVTELAEKLDVDPSTAYRLLSTLELHGFASQDADSKKYFLGYGVLEIASGVLGRLSVAQISQPHLLAVAASTGENAHLAVRDRQSAVFIASESGTGMLRVETTLGKAEPLHCTAVGKALIADYTRAQLAELFGEEPLHRYSAHTLTTIDDLETELVRVRRLGYAFDDEELHPGVRCIAAPVRDRAGSIVAAFGISAPTVHLTRESTAQIAEQICGAASAISATLGYMPEPVLSS